MLTEDEIKNLKKGDIVMFTSEVALITDNFAYIVVPDDDSCETRVAYADLSMPPSPPKYDPCRKFKKGDIVEPCSINGRWCSHTWEDRSGIYFEVAKDEDPLTAHMYLKDPSSQETFLAHAAFFKLVTPVEETEPYSIIVQPEGYHCVRIMKGTKIHSSIPFDEEECVCRTLEEAKAAAEEERDRLNAEYRKEQK